MPLRLLLAMMLTLFCLNSWADRNPLPPKVKKQIASILTTHEQLHSAFFTFNEKQIKAAADKLIEQIKRSNMSKVKRTMVLMRKDLEKFKSAKSRENYNKIYEAFSNRLVSVVKEYDVGANYNVYSCPMVKKKWVQDSSKKKRVHNPFAPEMPHCGQRDTDY